MTRLLLVLVLAAAAWAGDPDTLLERLESSDKPVVVQALTELARRGPPTNMREIENVRIHLADTDPKVRLAAATAAASVADDGSVPQLIAAMRAAGDGDGDGFRAALRSISGGDFGGQDPDAWSAWNDGVVSATQANCSRVRVATAAGDIDAARSALHPLLMQRCGRDTVVDLLEELGRSDNPRLVALAMEGLAAFDTAAARVALANLNATLPEGARSAREVAEAVLDETGRSESATVRRSAAATQAEGGGISLGGIVLGSIFLVILLFGAFMAGRQWLAIKEKAKSATQRFTRSIRRKR
jgi:hypothetical protein